MARVADGVYIIKTRYIECERYVMWITGNDEVENMELLRNPRCYTDVCIDGTWYHYDHCGSKVYSLCGGAAPELDLAREPETEGELISLIQTAIN